MLQREGKSGLRLIRTLKSKGHGPHPRPAQPAFRGGADMLRNTVPKSVSRKDRGSDTVIQPTEHSLFLHRKLRERPSR